MNSIIKLTTKNVIPNKRVNLLTNNSSPLSFLLLNKSELPPVIICDALSALLLCNNTTAIKRIEIIIKKTCMLSLLFSQYNLTYLHKKCNKTVTFITIFQKF